jgi:hypothetical protein
LKGEEDKSSSFSFATAREGEEDKSSSFSFATAREGEEDKAMKFAPSSLPSSSPALPHIIL